MEMEDQYAFPADLRHFATATTRPNSQFPPISHPPPDFYSPHHRLHVPPFQPYPFEMLPMGPAPDNTTNSGGHPSINFTNSGACLDSGTARWPRQETLTLLEIRSGLDHKFKEANQKGPLWDEVSRIMSLEHGYQRSGKKCREKFENLYKYYKKTKEGKAGRQDGKHYRFFRQLEALYGESSNTTPPSSNTNQEMRYLQAADSLSSLSNSTEFDTASSDDESNGSRKKKGKRSWKAKIKEFVDNQMRSLMEKQESWLEKMMRTLEDKEKERILREEEWRRQEAERMEKEHEFWARERAWIEARDSALMEALQKLTGNRVRTDTHEDDDDDDRTMERWSESEVSRLVNLRTSMESWEEIASRMASLGYDRSAMMYKEKWDSISKCLMKANKKRKENSRSHGLYGEINEQQQVGVPLEISPSHSNVNALNESWFRYFIGEGEHMWENYGVKINKGES